MSNPLYFDAYRYDAGDDSILCYAARFHRQEIAGTDVAQRRLYRAKPIKGSEFFYCRAHGEVGLKGEGCGLQCASYAPRNGRNGRCRHSANCYEADRSEVRVVHNRNVRNLASLSHTEL